MLAGTFGGGALENNGQKRSHSSFGYDDKFNDQLNSIYSSVREVDGIIKEHEQRLYSDLQIKKEEKRRI